MSRVLVVGANGALGAQVLNALGTERGVAVTRHDGTAPAGFDHVHLGEGGALPRSALSSASAIVNAAGRVNAAPQDLHDANVSLPLALARQARDAGVRKLVQVSSFSVYGACESIGADTPIAPETEYGRSKAEGDARLAELDAASLRIECIRLPFLFGVEQPGLIGPLLGAARRLPAWPVSRTPPRRSMMTYQDAGLILAEAAADTTRRGVSHAADPALFDFELFSQLLAEEAGERLLLLRLPGVLIDPLRWLVPGLHRRLFMSSVLSPEANLAAARKLPVGMEATIRRIIRHEAGPREAKVDSAPPSL